MQSLSRAATRRACERQQEVAQGDRLLEVDGQRPSRVLAKPLDPHCLHLPLGSRSGPRFDGGQPEVLSHAHSVRRCSVLGVSLDQRPGDQDRTCSQESGFWADREIPGRPRPARLDDDSSPRAAFVAISARSCCPECPSVNAPARRVTLT